MYRRPTLYAMLGYPGAGKTTTAQVISQLTGAEHLWADHERRQRYGHPTYNAGESHELYGVLNDRAEQLLRHGKSVVYDTAFNYYADRQKMRALAEKYGARLLVVWVKAPRDLAKHRATTSDDTGGGTRVTGDMPPSHFERLAGKLEPPRTNETYAEIDGTTVTPEHVRERLGL